MPEVRVNLSAEIIEILDKLKDQYQLSSRSQALELIIEQLLDDPEKENPAEEE